jgi:predicted nuclease of predicted toxin-antitoxin system
MLKIVTDVGVGKAVEEYLQQQGHDVLAVRELDPDMPDHDILALAVKEQRLVITMDKGFGELVYHSGEPHSGVLLLRLEDARSDEKVAVVKEIFNQYASALPNHFSVYQNGRLRIRH